MTITTIKDIYKAINPLVTAMLYKGRVSPNVQAEFEANTKKVYIILKWRRMHNPAYSGEETYTVCHGDTVDAALAMAWEKIDALPSAKEENTRAFMADLGKLIDSGREIGLEVEYLNPLVESMKKLSENIITYQPERKS